MACVDAAKLAFARHATITLALLSRSCVGCLAPVLLSAWGLANNHAGQL